MKQYSRNLVMFIWLFLLLLIRTNESSQKITKIIKSEDGDIIECVDIQRQPSLEDVVIDKHTTFEMQPHQSNMINKTNASTNALVHQLWQKSGNCPIGTIPVRWMTGKYNAKLDEGQLTACKTDVGVLIVQQFAPSWIKLHV